MPSQKINTKHENNNKNNKKKIWQQLMSIYTLLIYNYNYKYKRRDRFKLVAHTENKKKRSSRKSALAYFISYLFSSSFYTYYFCCCQNQNSKIEETSLINFNDWLSEKIRETKPNLTNR